MASTLGYNLSNRDDSSSSPTIRQSSGDQPSSQPHTLIINDSPQTSQHHHNLYQHHQSPRSTTKDPDLSSSPIPTTTTTTKISTTPLVKYRECLRNHAASMGSHVVDGCGEFMPSGDEGTPESLKCAACECHRNFHRKEVEREHQNLPNYHPDYPNKHNNGHLQFPTLPSSLSLHHQQHHRFSHVLATPTAGPVPPLMMAFGGPAESSSEDLNMFRCDAGAQLSVQVPPLSRKRYRTKFTQEQKDRMMEFAEKLGWKIQKHDEQEVQQFCSRYGVKRQVFKVWMHNNKQAMKKQQI